MTEKIVIFAEPHTISDDLVPTFISEIRECKNVEVDCIVDVNKKTCNCSTGIPGFLVSKFKIFFNFKFWIRKFLRDRNGRETRKNSICLKKSIIPFNSSIRIINPENGVNENDFIERMSKLSPDYIVLLGCSQILDEELINTSSKGVINYHWSKLPDYRGKFATFWPAYYDDESTGVTLHFINKEIDQGEILLQTEIPIDHNQGHESISAKCIREGRRMLRSLAQQIEEGNVNSKSKIEGGNYFSSEDYDGMRELDPHSTVSENLRRMRAIEEKELYFGGKRLKITSFSKISKEKYEVSDYDLGQVVDINSKGIIIKVKDGLIVLEECYYLPATWIAKIKGVNQGQYICNSSG